jgi:hypothetical protein
MVVNRGGLLASTGAVLAMAGLSSRFRAPEGEPGGDGAGGGGAAVVEEEEDFFGGAGGGGAGGDDDAAAAAAAAAAKAAGGGADDDAGGGAIEVPEWAKSFSGEKKEGEQLSNQEWIAKLKVKDPDALVQLARDNQKALRDSGRVKVPGEGATEADVKAYREAIGAPLEAAGYAVELPAAAAGFELDTAFIDPMKEIALKHNLPAAAFKDLGDAFMAAQLATLQQDAAAANTERDATIKGWGAEAEQGKEEFRRGLDVCKLKTGDAKMIQSALGAKRTLELFRSIGQMAGEDFFAGNNGRPAERFGVADEASAKQQLEAMEKDPETRKKLRAKDPMTVNRFNGLTEALAHFRAAKAKA